jgi:superfamily I DNA and/or RNA helicase
MEKEMFDFVVSDESSQLLLSHSIGAFQRGKKSVICGDPQQMVPSSYFKKKQVTEMSLLQHAFYHLPKVFLSNHYRSRHPRLIAFSNANFYQNRLKSFQNIKAVEDPIEHHFIPDGIYHERQNKKEANAIAQKIKIEIDKKLKIGIVAFSEIQLQLIHECLENEVSLKLNKRIEEKSAFAHSLENVQGDECDLLFISMGYGFNKESNFEMRFGPVNVNGGHHRLNVLFSRAKQKIHFFSSVEHKDFSKSNNEGVRHLIKWFELMKETNPDIQPDENLKFDEIICLSDGFDDILSYTSVNIDNGYSIHL